MVGGAGWGSGALRPRYPLSAFIPMLLLTMRQRAVILCMGVVGECTSASLRGGCCGIVFEVNLCREQLFAVIGFVIQCD